MRLVVCTFYNSTPINALRALCVFLSPPFSPFRPSPVALCPSAGQYREPEGNLRTLAQAIVRARRVVRRAPEEAPGAVPEHDLHYASGEDQDVRAHDREGDARISQVLGRIGENDKAKR